MAAVAPLLDEDTGGGSLDAPALPPTACRGPQIGVHSTLAFEGSSERRQSTVAAIDDTLHAQVVRDSLLWHQIEPVEGERDWSRLDSAVEEIRGAGMEPLLTVVGSPEWANGVPESTDDQYLYVPPRGPELDAWLEHYSDFVSEAAERYRGVVRRWEIWNEPNLVAFWHPRPDPVAYLQIYEKLRKTILSADRDADVAVGGLTNLTRADEPDVSGRAFLRHLMRARAPLDSVAIHPYPTNQHPPNLHVPGENNFDDIERIHDELAAGGKQAPIWVTEWGWSSETVGEDAQAAYVNRSLAMIQHRYPYVEVATYFADYDRPPEFFSGLLDEDLEPKPAAAVFRTHADLAASRCEGDWHDKPPHP